MSPAGHAFRTWLVAHALHPVTLVGWWYMNTKDEDILNICGAGCLFGLILSIHTIFFFWAGIDGIIRSKLSLTAKFVIWVIIAPLMTHISVVCLLFVFGGPASVLLFTKIFVFTAPAMMATVFSIIIRYPQFRELNNVVNNNYDKQDFLLP